jgi:hypothetical protein
MNSYLGAQNIHSSDELDNMKMQNSLFRCKIHSSDAKFTLQMNWMAYKYIVMLLYHIHRSFGDCCRILRPPKEPPTRSFTPVNRIEESSLGAVVLMVNFLDRVISPVPQLAEHSLNSVHSDQLQYSTDPHGCGEIRIYWVSRYVRTRSDSTTVSL